MTKFPKLLLLWMQILQSVGAAPLTRGMYPPTTLVAVFARGGGYWGRPPHEQQQHQQQQQLSLRASKWGRGSSTTTTLTNPLNPIYRVTQPSHSVVYSFDLPTGVRPDDLTVDVDYDDSVLHVKGRRMLGRHVNATTQLDEEIPLDATVLNVHDARVEVSDDGKLLRIVVGKRQRSQRLAIEKMNDRRKEGE